MKTIISLLISLVLIGCLDTAIGPVAKESTLVWVGHTYVGGRQCTNDNYRPPNTKHLLNAAGIAVAEIAIEHHPVCAACFICPEYAATHYALILKHQQSEAEALGYYTVDPPSVTFRNHLD
jgi:hypothetical protein